MSRETYGRTGLLLPVPGTQERYSTAIEVDNLKKLSAELDSLRNKVDELYSRTYKNHQSQGESLSSIGSVKSGWKVTQWAFDCRGYVSTIRLTVQRTGGDIKTGSTGNIGNVVCLTLQPRFRSVSAIGLTPQYVGGLIAGATDSSGDVTITATVPNRGIKKGDTVSLSGVMLMASPGLA